MARTQMFECSNAAQRIERATHQQVFERPLERPRPFALPRRRHRPRHALHGCVPQKPRRLPVSPPVLPRFRPIFDGGSPLSPAAAAAAGEGKAVDAASGGAEANGGSGGGQWQKHRRFVSRVDACVGGSGVALGSAARWAGRCDIISALGRVGVDPRRPQRRQVCKALFSSFPTPPRARRERERKEITLSTLFTASLRQQKRRIEAG